MIILFDMDGTIIDSTSAIYSGFCAVFKECNLKIPSKFEVSNLIGYPLDSMFTALGVEKNAIKFCVESYKKHYRAIHRAQTIIFPAALEAIKLASKMAHLGVVTTKTHRATSELLEHFGVRDLFKCIVGFEDVTHPKPHSEPIELAIERINESVKTITKKENIFMIGDTILDLEAAKNAGIYGVGVLCGYGRKQDLARFSPYIFNDCLEAVKFIGNLA